MLQHSIRKTVVVNWIIGVLVFGLPLHGGATVLLPGVFRWWKELLLVLLGALWLHEKWQSQTLLLLEKSGLALLSWIGLLVFTSSEMTRSAYAARFLILPIVGIAGTIGLIDIIDKKRTLRWLVAGATLSSAFGLWAHLGGGYAVIEAWWSGTISSWVPGQTIPLYHEINGAPRLQGLASGPVALGHLALVGLWASFHAGLRPAVAWAARITLLVAMWLSASRGALGGALIVLLWEAWQAYKKDTQADGPFWIGLFARQNAQHIQHIRTAQKWGIIAVLPLFAAATALLPKIMRRAGTSEHFTRPLEVLKTWAAGNWFTGQIGQIGPAARWWNLHQYKNDTAPIAENVWIDVLAQTGLIGLGLWIAIATLLWRKTAVAHRGLLLAVLATTQLATLWDMAPVSLTMAVGLALATQLAHTPADA